MAKARLSLLAVSFMFSLALKAQQKDSLAVISAASNFVTAFNNFNWEAFRESFTDDATIFYPFWEQARRIQGRQEFEAKWLEIFPEFGDKNNKEKLQINPKDIHIQMYGQTAIVTFHLGDGVKSLSRRTLVMLNTKGVWKIAHLHASSVSENKQ